MMSSKNRGFSLLEILVTVIVLSMLALVSYLTVPSLINKAHDARRKADLQKIKIYLEGYYNDKGVFPRTLPDCDQFFVFNNDSNLPKFPCDPTTKDPYFYEIKGGQPQSYRVYALLTNNEDPSIEEVGCLGGCGPDCFYNYGVSSSNIGLIRCSYVCAPGIGKDKTGHCELFMDLSTSQCPVEYGKDSTCNNECGDRKNICKNASGKNVSY